MIIGEKELEPFVQFEGNNCLLEENEKQWRPFVQFDDHYSFINLKINKKPHDQSNFLVWSIYFSIRNSKNLQVAPHVS